MGSVQFDGRLECVHSGTDLVLDVSENDSSGAVSLGEIGSQLDGTRGGLDRPLTNGIGLP